MASKLFKECDSWGDSSGFDGDISFSFKKTPKTKKDKQNKKSKKGTQSDIDNVPEVGKYVRAPKDDDLGVQQATSPESNGKTKKNKRKRKHEKVEGNNNIQSSDGITPEKKLKKQNVAPVVASDRPASFSDKLRENLKGSRFRFLNEQMYKQPGEESMKIFQEDETAFEAYHEGYRHQISQWPMNPLDRLIKNIKRL